MQLSISMLRQIVDKCNYYFASSYANAIKKWKFARFGGKSSAKRAQYQRSKRKDQAAGSHSLPGIAETSLRV